MTIHLKKIWGTGNYTECGKYYKSRIIYGFAFGGNYYGPLLITKSPRKTTCGNCMKSKRYKKWKEEWKRY